jgi:hypothetical protein
MALGTRKGRFTRTYRFRSAGLFRFYVTFAGDKANAATKSSAVYVRALPAVKVKAPGGSTRGGGIAPY